MSRPLRRLTAREELTLSRAAGKLLPGLLRYGLAADAALALSHNAALAFFALAEKDGMAGPEDVLDRLGLGEIAGLCEAYLELGDDGEVEM